MLQVKTSQMVFSLFEEKFKDRIGQEIIRLGEARGRILAEDVYAEEDVPEFDRSTVDGYAIRAADTFGCSDSLPALLKLKGEVRMGEMADTLVDKDSCVAIPTGGALPEGADACVMIEYTEDYGDGTIGILKSAVPGAHLIFRGDDVKKGQLVIKKGSIIEPGHMGALAAMGITEVAVRKQVKVGLFSTGDELVLPEEIPKPGQIRDINSTVIRALLDDYGALVSFYGIIRDDKKMLGRVLDQALKENDIVLMSGGSSVGIRDSAAELIRERGKLLFHGIAVKPGKPTLLGEAGSKVIMGLPGHPAAAYFITRLFCLRLLDIMTGKERKDMAVQAILTENLASNHGREEYIPVQLTKVHGHLEAKPLRSKSGLISTMARTEGYICIDRDLEGLEAGRQVEVILY